MTNRYQELLSTIPENLRAFAVDQHYDRYTARDQSVWRYIMRRNLAFLRDHAHPVYLDGLRKTGISIDTIPDINTMNDSLEKIGWRAVIVNGFIPPAAFMEFQAHKILVISAEMRSIGHILYTPAPDIVHEAAGHAPIIADPEYAEYLQRFGQYGSMAMASKADHEVYEAIRALSIIKEYPQATTEEISAAETDLKDKMNAIRKPSEAAKLSRLHWWTVEYGLFGTPDNFSLYGAGLLSSVGESKECLRDSVKKIPLSLDCINYSYDITSMQPQLFVTPSWSYQMDVLEQFADTMCFRRGGTDSLDQAIESGNIATVVLSSGLQISGKFERYDTDDSGRLTFIATSGPSALACENSQINNCSIEFLAEGFLSPLGKLKYYEKPLSHFEEGELTVAKLSPGLETTLDFQSGYRVNGTVHHLARRHGRLLMVKLKNATVTAPDGSNLFHKTMPELALAVGDEVLSVFAGSADREKFNITPHKSQRSAMEVRHSDKEKELFSMYQEIALMHSTNHFTHRQVVVLNEKLNVHYPDEWLMRVELLEFAKRLGSDSALIETLTSELEQLKSTNPDIAGLIESGITMSEVRTGDLLRAPAS
jgi:phenylalanine-4-hydroxylase